MRCSRTGMMLCGPNTIENGTMVAGKPCSRCSRSRIASHASLSRPYCDCRSVPSTGELSRIGSTFVAA